METMEEYKTIRIINEEPEFMEGEKTNVSADFFILCDDEINLFNQHVYDVRASGMSLLNWVVRACGRQPKILKIEPGQEILDVIKPYVDYQAEYSVVLFADTPLVNRSHIFDLLGFVHRKRMSVCWLKRGAIFNNDYIRENNEFYSVDEYDFSSNDFMKVDTYENFYAAKKVLSQKIIDYHKNNGVYFGNEDNVTIDANVEIGVNSKIGAGACIVNGSKLGENVSIGQNCMVSGSKVGANTSVCAGTKVLESVVKNNVHLAENVTVKSSVIGNNCSVQIGTNIVSSSLRDGVVIKEFVCASDARIAENAVIQKYSKILGLTENVIIGASSEIGGNCEIIDSKLLANSFIDNNTKLKNKVEE